MAISIDIGTRNIHIARGKISGSGGNIQVDQLAMEKIPGGLIQDGVIREFAGMETALKNALDTNRIKDRNCIITINGNHIYTREIEVPKSKPQVMSNVVTFEVQNAISGNKDVWVEYISTKHQNPDQPNLKRVRASAISSEYILDYAKLLKTLKLKPIAMDIHPNAISKLLVNRSINATQGQENNLMLMDVGCVTTTAYVISDGEISYTRIIPTGTIDIDRYLTNQNADAKPEAQLKHDQINLSLDVLRNTPALGDALRPLVTVLTDGVNRIQQFLSGRIQGNRINTIYIYGLGSTFNGFEETLSQSMNLKVEKISRLSGVKLPGNQDPAPYLNAIGALIRLKG